MSPTFLHVLALWLGLAAVCAAAADAETFTLILVAGFVAAILIADGLGRY